ncbi:magnesium transporter NIPA-domain-containing protein [Gongronella butleri]|nr:magnesium transporter NIPA-domain-containing protein [Gongronella butleri]
MNLWTIPGGGLVETDTLIGILLSISGNVLISFALNIQKLAHNKLSIQTHEKRAYSRRSSSSPSIDSELDRFIRFDQDKKGELDYLHSKTWWLGITLMIAGEAGNFMAYGFAPASTIAPLGTVTLVSNAILAPCLLNEQFRTRDLFGVIFAVGGAAGVVWSAKTHDVKLSPDLVLEALTDPRSLGFYIVSLSLLLLLSLLSPVYGARSILVDLGIAALYGAYTVLATKGLSSMVNLTLYKLFTYPISYILLLILISTAVMQIKHLSRALQYFDGVAVIPTQFVLFTISAIVASAIVYRDFDDDDADHLVKFIFGCLVEFLGVFLITSNRRRAADAADADPMTMHSQSPPQVVIHHATAPADDTMAASPPPPLPRSSSVSSSCTTPLLSSSASSDQHYYS